MAQPQFAALIADMVQSRRSTDRGALQKQMTEVLAEIEAVTGVRPHFTIGDEFQARYESLGEAILASLYLHLRSWQLTRLRIGIGWGDLLTEEDETTPFGEDGPCWWRARDAIEALDARARGRGPGRRTLVRTETALDPLLNGYLLLRDTVMDGFDQIDAELAIGLLSGRTQTELASDFGMNKSSVSRRVNGHGVLAVLDSAAITVPPVPSRT